MGEIKPVGYNEIAACDKAGKKSCDRRNELARKINEAANEGRVNLYVPLIEDEFGERFYRFGKRARSAAASLGKTVLVSKVNDFRGETLGLIRIVDEVR